MDIQDQYLHWEKNAIESKAFLSKSMYIANSNQYSIELVTYLLVLVVYFYEFIVYMLLEWNVFDPIAFFSQCRYSIMWQTSHIFGCNILIFSCDIKDIHINLFQYFR